MRVAGGLAALLLGMAIVIVQPAATALTPKEIADIAQQITVRIDGANTGSGVIIERQSNVYTVVTNWHVVQLKGNYTVYTPDGQPYKFNHSQVKRFPGIDLAVFQFTSNANYRVAEKGNSDQVELGTNISVAGYPQGTSDIKFIKGAISSRVSNPKDGYAFVYDIGGFPGMSGGAILDEQGKLVGIHGRATTRPDTSAVTLYGIPLRTYLSLAPFLQSVAKFTLVKTLIGHSQKVIKSSITNDSFREGSVWSLAFSPDGKTLASGSLDKTIKIWNIATRKEIRTLKAHSQAVDSLAISSDGRTLVSICGLFCFDGIKIWNLATGQEIRTLKYVSNKSLNFATSVAISPDANTLANGNSDNTIKIWNLATGQEILTLNGHSDPVDSVAIAPDNKTLVSSSFDKTIKIWNLVTGQEIRTINHNSYVASIAISPDSKTLATSSDNDKNIKIWNITTGQVIRILNGHSNRVNSVTFSPDGTTLASGSGDKTIKIWNVSTGQDIATLKGHSDSVWSVAFSPDGKTLASGSYDATIKIWRLSE